MILRRMSRELPTPGPADRSVRKPLPAVRGAGAADFAFRKKAQIPVRGNLSLFLCRRGVPPGAGGAEKANMYYRSFFLIRTRTFL